MYDLIVVGGGPAGLAAACKAWDEGVKNILVLEHGKVLELGTPQELLEKGGLFRQIYDMQMSIGEGETA